MPRIKLRRDLAEYWATTNPVLHEGEPGYEIDTGYMKVGNGDAQWLDLPYLYGTSESSGTTMDHGAVSGELILSSLYTLQELTMTGDLEVTLEGGIGSTFGAMISTNGHALSLANAAWFGGVPPEDDLMVTFVHLSSGWFAYEDASGTQLAFALAAAQAAQDAAQDAADAADAAAATAAGMAASTDASMTPVLANHSSAFWAEFTKSVTHVTPQMFGAVGNGIADDTIPVQAALDSGKAVFIRGNFLVGNLVDTGGTTVFGLGATGSKLKAKPGTTGTLYTALNIAGKQIQDLWFDGNGQVATCVDTSWSTVGPSQGNVYSNVRVSGYSSVGWIAANNNDSLFTNVLIEASVGATLSLRILAGGGLVEMSECRFILPFELDCQTLNIRGGFYKGLHVAGGSWNVIQITGGYWYADPVTHNNIDINATKSCYNLSFVGSHVENAYTDGAVIGGTGLVLGVVKFLGGHVFQSPPGTTTKLIGAGVGVVGPQARVDMEDVFIEGGDFFTMPTNWRMWQHNCTKSGVYLGSTARRGMIADTSGGSEVMLTGTGLAQWTGSIGETTMLKRSIATINNGTTGVFTFMPRSGFVFLKGTATVGASLLAYYHRNGTSAGTVTVLASTAGAGGETYTLTIPSGNAQDTFTTALSVTHTAGSPQIIAVLAYGF